MNPTEEIKQRLDIVEFINSKANEEKKAWVLLDPSALVARTVMS